MFGDFRCVLKNVIRVLRVFDEDFEFVVNFRFIVKVESKYVIDIVMIFFEFDIKWIRFV